MALPNPTAYYALDEAGGTDTASDSAGTVDLSTINGTPSVVTGKNNDGRSFNNTAYVQQASDSSAVVCGNVRDSTIAFWLKFDAAGITTAQQQQVLARTNEFKVLVEPTGGGNVAVSMWNGTAWQGWTGTTGWGDDAWHQVVLRFHANDRRLRIWVDGSEQQDSTIGGGPVIADGAATNRIQIGADSANGLVEVDEVAFFCSDDGGGGLLSDADLADLYNAGTGSFWTGTAWTGSGGGGTGFHYYRMRLRMMGGGF